MPNTKRGFGGVGIIIAILIVLGLGTYFWSQKKVDNSFKTLPAPTSDTSNWKTYRNDKYGFEVKYPASWEQCWSRGDNVGSFPDHILCMEEPRGVEYVLGPRKLELVLVTDVFKDTSNIDQLKSRLEKSKTEFGLPLIKKPFGEIPFLLAGGCDAGCTHTNYVFLKDKNLLDISYTSDSDIDIHTLNDQILSTFRFVK